VNEKVSPTRRRPGAGFTTYIATAAAGLIVGMSAWFMSHAGPAVPAVTFGTAADSPAPAVRAGHAIPTAAAIDRHPVHRGQQH
jgi:hypothetical protein